MCRSIAQFIVLAAAVFSVSLSDAAERVAIVIGNGDYQSKRR